MKFNWINNVPLEDQDLILKKEKEVYLDNNANHPMLPEVVEIVQNEMKYYGNASAIHSLGRQSMAKIIQARNKIASLLKVKPNNIIFTSGGSESNNMFIKGLISKKLFVDNNLSYKIFLSPFEHKSISRICFPGLNYRKISSPSTLFDIIKNREENNILCITHIYAHNETGIIYKAITNLFEDIRKLDPSILFHSDMSQVIGKTEFPNLDIFDAVSFSAHKFGGPLGCGILYLKNLESISPLINGGPQEFQLRAGTYNVPGILGMARAMELSINLDMTEMRNLRDYMVEEIFKMHPSRLISTNDKLITNTAAMILENINAEQLVKDLSQFGIYISRGSACDSLNKKPSDSYLAAGFSEKEANSIIRISLNRYTSKDDIDYFLSKLKYCIL